MYIEVTDTIAIIIALTTSTTLVITTAIKNAKLTRKLNSIKNQGRCMYLDDIAEQIRKYKVVTYTDHKQDNYVMYYDDYNSALDCWRRELNSNSAAKYTASVALIRVDTGEPIMRQTWRT